MAEKLCSECNFVFSSQISYNIHLKTCKENVNYDPKNKYFCPSCCRQFRIFDNLKRHEETKKHLELFNWEKKQLSDVFIKDIQKSDPSYDPNVKVITLTRELILKENKVDIPNDINESVKKNIESNSNQNKQNKQTEQNIASVSNSIKVNEEELNFDKFDLLEDKLDGDDLKFEEFVLNEESINNENLNTSTSIDILFNNDNHMNMNINVDIDVNTNINDPFLEEIDNRLNSNIENSNIENNNIENNNVDNVIDINIDINKKIKEEGHVNDSQLDKYNNFFEKLISDRENMLKSLIKLPETSLKNNLETNNENILKEQIEEDTIDLKDEIINTQKNLTFYTEYYQSELNYKTQLYGKDSLLNTIQNTRDNGYNGNNGNNIKNIELNANVINHNKIEKNNKTNKYPIDFKSKPIWKYLEQTIYQKDYLNKINNLFIVNPFNDYLFICTFIFYSEDLDDKLEIRFKLISSIIELNKYFQNLLSSKKYIWNGKNIMDCINLFNKLKINDQYSRCKNELDRIK